MARYGIPGMMYLDNNGKPLSAGKLFFYESGTEADKTTYSDYAETIPNEQPVILTADGRQPAIFFSGDAKIVIQTSTGVQINESDPVGEGIADLDFSVWADPVNYDIGDIVTDSNGNYYVSFASENQGNIPASSPTKWMEFRFINVYNAAFSYSAGDVALSGTSLYYSRVGTNVGNTPATSPTQWRPLNTELWLDLTPKTANFTAEVGRSYLIDTTGGTFTMTLPLSPANGDKVGLTDYGEYFGTEVLTIGRNGQEIMNTAADMDADVTYFSGSLTFTTDRGWIFA